MFCSFQAIGSQLLLPSDKTPPDTFSCLTPFRAPTDKPGGGQRRELLWRKSNLSRLELRPGIWTDVRTAILGIMIALLNDLKHGLRPRKKYFSFGFTLHRFVVVPEPSPVKFAVCANETAVELYYFGTGEVERHPRDWETCEQ